MGELGIWMRRLIAAAFSAVCDRLDRRYCRHVVARRYFKYFGGEVFRCGEPADPGCVQFHCTAHCILLCSCGNDGPEGDEEDVDPPSTWEPKKDAQGRVKIEA